jgi:hypothetical protein
MFVVDVAAAAAAAAEQLAFYLHVVVAAAESFDDSFAPKHSLELEYVADEAVADVDDGETVVVAAAVAVAVDPDDVA